MRSMSAGAFTVHTTTRKPSPCASAIFAWSTSPKYGDQTLPPAALTIRATEPPWSRAWKPAVHAEPSGLPAPMLSSPDCWAER